MGREPLVYEFALALCLVAHEWSIASSGPSPRSRRLSKVVGGLFLVDGAVLAAIIVTGGIDAQIGPMRVVAHDIFNQLQAFWILVALFLWLRLRPRVDSRRNETLTASPARAVLIMTGVFMVVAAPHVLPLKRIAEEGVRSLCLVSR